MLVKKASMFITSYLAFKFYKYSIPKQDIKIKLKNTNIILNKSSLLSFNVFRLICHFYYAAFNNNINYKDSFYVNNIDINYIFTGRRYYKTFIVQNLRNFYESKSPSSRDAVIDTVIKFIYLMQEIDIRIL